jgi:hypothetical protein
MPKKESMHLETKSKKVVRRATRKQQGEKKKWNGQEGGGPGRPKGSTLDKTWRLTPRQMEIAQKIIDATNSDGLFPSSITQLAKSIGAEKHYVRELLRRETFHKYLTYLLLQDGIMLEVSFWRGMQLGLQVGDARVLQLYAQMTGKIAKKEAPVLKVELISPDGSRTALPAYTDEIEDAIVVEEEDA